MKLRIFFFSCIFLAVRYVAMAQPGLAPCDKNHYEIWSETFADYYNEEFSFQYIVSPSFQSPYALYIPSCFGWSVGKRVLTYKQNKNKWTLACDSAMIRRLNVLVRYSVRTSMFCYESFGLDGVTHFFFDGSKGAYCWTPSITSVTGGLVSVMEQVCKAVQRHDISLLQRQQPTIDSLIYYFKRLMPAEWSAVTVVESTISGNGEADKHEVELTTCGGMVRLLFTFSAAAYNDGLPEALLKKYRSVLETFSRRLFQQTHVLELGETLSITVNNERPFELRKVLGWGYKAVVSEADLNVDTLLERFCELDEKASAGH